VCAAVVARGWGGWVNGGALGSASEPPVRIAAIEPGWHPEEIRFAPTPAENVARYDELLRTRVIEPTRRELAREPVPDLILWPESSVYGRANVADVDAGRTRVNTFRLPASTTRLVIGSEVRYPDGQCPAALLVELPSGRVLGHHDKQWLVPGGEFLPLIGLLPDAVADWLSGLFERALGTPPDVVPGGPQPPLQTTAGVPFGAMLCYDNAFPGPAREQVARGARLLVVLSNEAWFRGGGEVEQLVAMTVMRALETATPIVRCTLDGWSVAVDGRGRLLGGLDLLPAPQPAARILRVSLPPGRGEEPPMAWLRRLCGPVFAALCALVAAHTLWRWVRLRAAPTAVPAAPGPGPSGRRGGGS
jgi:apolipoprotein N-acyltransferase